MSETPFVFQGTGAIQTYVVPASGSYVIEACGAQGGDGGGEGGKGARVKGTFQLNEGEILQIVVGLRGRNGSAFFKPAGGGGGGSFVWKGSAPLPLPEKPMLAAGAGGGGPGRDGVVTIDAEEGLGLGGLCGYGGSTDYVDFHYSGGGGAGWRSNGAMGSSPTYSNGGSRWTGGHGADYCGHRGGTGGFGGGGGGSIIGYGSGGGGGYSGGGGGTENGPGGGGGASYNGGTDQTNTPGIQLGDGSVSLALLATSAGASCAEISPGLASWKEAGANPLTRIRPKEMERECALLQKCG